MMTEPDAKKAAAKLAELLERAKKGDRQKFIDQFKELRSYGYDSDGNTKQMYSGLGHAGQ